VLIENIIRLIKRSIPFRIKRILKGIIFIKKYGFMPPPDYSDSSGYEIILDFLRKHKIYEIDGDVVEIGVFLGGGTYKLCKFYEKISPVKSIYAVDIFDPEFDNTLCCDGQKMNNLYKTHLDNIGGTSQIDIFESVTKRCRNMKLLIGDSKDIVLPCSKVSFAYIDGNHSSEYVMSDFYKIWEKLAHGGVIALDDYGYDLPNVTETINKIIGRESANIKKVCTAGLKTVFIIKKDNS
jgi:hypothetical protein